MPDRFWMRIEFINRERDTVHWDGQPLRLGSGADCDLLLTDPGVAPHHLTLQADTRGIVLDVAPGAGHVYVNARPVRERALLRPGDSLGVAQCQIRLCHGRDAHPGSAVHRSSVVSLRALSGPLSGRSWRIGDDGLTLGEGGRVPLRLPTGPRPRIQCLWRGDMLWLQGPEAGECTLRVDGEPTTEAMLHAGEQIAIGPHRFVVDAAGAHRGESSSDAPIDVTDGSDDAGPRAEVWWLLATAAALALLIALVLVRL